MKKCIVMLEPLILLILISFFLQWDKVNAQSVEKHLSKSELEHSRENGTLVNADLKFDKSQVLLKMEMVANWQLVHQDSVKDHDLKWTNAVLYSGMMELAKITEDFKYKKWLIKIGRQYKWQPFNDMYKADDIAVSQMYLDMYRNQGDIRMFYPTQARTEWVINHPSISSLNLDYNDYHTSQRWSWCDALFMAPPVYAQIYSITNDIKYLIFMDKEYRMTYNLLYDQEEHLFYRDCSYFEKREQNGKKVFWGRGNGWVMGGLVKILKELPEYSEYRLFYEELFKEMSEKLITLQDADGYWDASLLDVASYPNPETSGTGLYVYALAFGINSGLLEKEKYLPMVEKGWIALNNAVYPDGKLGWVQPVGGNPQMTKKDMTEVYGVGAFLLAGSEIYQLSKKQN